MFFFTTASAVCKPFTGSVKALVSSTFDTFASLIKQTSTCSRWFLAALKLRSHWLPMLSADNKNQAKVYYRKALETTEYKSMIREAKAYLKL